MGIYSITPISASKVEGTGGLTAFTFQVTGQIIAPFSFETVFFSVAGSGATPANGADFSTGLLPFGSLTFFNPNFLPATQSQTLTIQVAADTLAELDEGFSVTISGQPTTIPTAFATIFNDDPIVGGAGNDVLNGTVLNDTLQGVGANDTLNGSNGNDSLDGGTGLDTANYAALGQAITLKSQGVIEKAGGLGTDTIAGVETIIGGAGLANLIDGQVVGAQTTAFNVNLGTNSLVVNGIPGIGSAAFTVQNFRDVRGTANFDVVVGNGAANTFFGSRGNDSYNGGAGIDTIDYTSLGQRVTLKAQGSIEKANGFGTDTIVGMERIIGTLGQFNVIDGRIVGPQVTSFDINLSTNNLSIKGIPGGTQSFFIQNFTDVRGTANRDIIVGDGSFSFFFGSAGADVYDGGAGSDRIDYSDLGQKITLLSQGKILKGGGLGTDTIANINQITGATGQNNFIDGKIAGAVQATSFNVNLDVNILTVNNIPGLGNVNFDVFNFTDVRGTLNNDVVTGNAAANNFFGSKGNDTYDGRAGIDTIDYVALGKTITLLAQGQIEKSGGFGTDSILGMERIIGKAGLANLINGQIAGPQITSFNINLGANSLIINGIPGGPQNFTVENFPNVRGTANSDVITGSGGANTFFGSRGNDIYNGAGGSDTVNYADLGQAVTLLAQGVIQKAGGFGTDSIANMERIIGAGGQKNVIDGKVVGPQQTSFVVNLTTETLTVRDVGVVGNNITFGVENFVDVRGTANKDLITGSAAGNLFVGTAGSDVYDGAAGSDTIDYTDLGVKITLQAQGKILKAAGLGTDTIANMERITGAGGEANLIDGLVVGPQTTSFNINLGTKSLIVNGVPGVPGGTISFLVTNFLDVRGTANADTIVGSGGVNHFFGSRGNDVYDGAGGVDTIDYAGLGQAVTLKAQGQITKAGGSGTDTIANMEKIVGATGQSNFIDGLIAGPQITSFDINLALNQLKVLGIPGGTQTFTVENFVRVRGTANADTITGGAGANTIEGGAGNDIIDGGAAGDSLNGGSGIDTVSYASIGAAVKVDLSIAVAQGTAGGGVDTIVNFENLTGSGFNDTLRGSATNNVIAGGNGNDSIEGSTGADTLTGGIGADVFLFKTLTDSTSALAGRDRISDFSEALGDRIDVSAIDANANLGGNQAFVLVAGGFTGVAGQISISNAGADRTVRFDTDGDGVENFAISVTSGAALTAGAFIL